MKKSYRTLIILLTIILVFVASFFLVKKVFENRNRVLASYAYAIDGDTAVFVINDEEVVCRFLAIDTPEIGEYYYEESTKYVDEILENGQVIMLEGDENADDYDKYQRKLVWVFVDNELLQKDIIENGYGKVAYLYGDYKYTSILQKAQEKAKGNKLGIWKKRDQ